MAHPRILLIAESADPTGSGAALDGWRYASTIGSVADVHLVTHARHRSAIESAGLVHGQDFSTFDVRGDVVALADAVSERRVGHWATTAAQALAYGRFEDAIWLAFRSRLRQRQFDVVHRLTPFNPAIPSPIASRLKEVGVPFVLGPMSGPLPVPQAFDETNVLARQPWMRYVREAYQFLPGYRSTRGCASAIIVGSRDAADRLPRGFADRCFYIPTPAIDVNRFTKARQRVATRPIQVLFVGALTEAKAPDMLLEAVAPLVNAGKVTLDVLGDGPLYRPMMDTVVRDGLVEGVRLHGHIDPAELQEWLVDGDVLALPSVRNTSGRTVLEAMAVGLPCAVVDYGAPGELVTEQTGFLVPAGARHDIILGFRELLNNLWNDPESIESRTEAARRRVAEQLTWDAKGAEIANVYRWLLQDEVETKAA